MAKKRGRARIDYRQEIAVVHSRQQWTAWLILLAFLILLPFLLKWSRNMTWLTFLNFTLIYIIGVLGLNITTGMAGQISLGHAAFLIVGGYGLAILTTQLGWSFWPAAALAVFLTAVIGGLVALPAMRLKGFYVAVVTLAFFFIVQYVMKNLKIAGDINGLTGIPRPPVGTVSLTSDIHWYYFVLAITVGCVLASVNIGRSRYGRAFLAIRDNEVTAASLGINVPLAKLRAFAIGALFGGLAGVLMTSYLSVIRLDQFSLWDSIWYVGMIIIGGMGSTAGTVMGVIFLQLIQRILNVVSAGHLIPLSINVSVALTFAIFGLAIILFMYFQPHGLIAIWHKFRINYKRWPFGE